MRSLRIAGNFLIITSVTYCLLPVVLFIDRNIVFISVDIIGHSGLYMQFSGASLMLKVGRM
jgi:hypothetical protein